MTPPDEPTVAAQVLALQGLTVDQLRARYADLYGEETRGRHKVWLFRACAWRLQELAFGGVSERAKRRAEELVREGDVRPRVPQTLPSSPGRGPPRREPPRPGGPEPAPARDRPGPPLQGPGGAGHRARRRLRVRRDGVRELIAVAQAVTGAHWSGDFSSAPPAQGGGGGDAVRRPPSPPWAGTAGRPSSRPPPRPASSAAPSTAGSRSRSATPPTSAPSTPSGRRARLRRSPASSAGSLLPRYDDEGHTGRTSTARHSSASSPTSRTGLADASSSTSRPAQPLAPSTSPG